MAVSDELLEHYFLQHNKYSIQTSWHSQYLIENLLDLDGFISSISVNLEEEKIEKNCYSYPLGFFQVEQPSRIRYTQIVFLFTILERRVRALIKLTTELKPDVKCFSDYKGSFLNRTRSFVKDNLEIDLSSDKEWQDIMVLQKIRDCIIHCGGNINESRDVVFLKQLVENKKIDLNKNDYLLLNDDFSHELSCGLKEFVLTALEKLYKILVDLENKKNAKVNFWGIKE